MNKPLTNRARKGDPQTSIDAGIAIEDTIRDTQRKVLYVLRSYEDRGLTDGDLTDRCAVFYGWPTSSSTARTRRSELTALGLVVDTGRRRKLKSGRMAIVWRAKPIGALMS